MYKNAAGSKIQIVVVILIIYMYICMIVQGGARSSRAVGSTGF